jgi:ribulose 1,5-bisphosphate synthetase/thiazole synthase
MVEQVVLAVVEETKAEVVTEQQVPPDKVMQAVALVDSHHQIIQLAAEAVQAQQVLIHQMPQPVEPVA